MANSNFVVKNGLTVGALEIDAATGNVTTTGTISGNLSTTSIAKNDTSIALTDTGSGSDVSVTIDGSTIFNITADGIIPTINSDGTTGYSLGSPSFAWKDVFVSSGSLYVNGQKVLQEDSGNIVVSADANQNLVFQTSGTGDLELNPVGTGVVSIKGALQITAGKNITSSDGNPITFSNAIAVDSLSSKTADTDLTLTGAGTGKVYINDNLETSGNVVVGGNLTVSGTTTTVNSETISLADNIIDLNSNFTTGAPSENAGLRVLRGDEAAVQVRWTESDDKWQFTNDGTNYLSFASLAGTETLTNKTIAAGSNTITGLSNTNLSGTAAISNANLANSAVTVGSTSISLGGSATTIAGLTSVTSTGFTGALTGNADTATSATSATSAGKWTTARTITLGGDLSGSVSVDGSANVTLTATIADDSHNHTIANIDGLQSALDGKLGTSANAVSASILATARTIALSGDVSGSVSFDGSANVTLTATIADDSHNHTIANIDGLQAELDGKLTAGATSGSGISGSAASGTFTVTSNATSANTASTIVFRDASGNFSAGVMTGTATNARYADLAENYVGDRVYEAGTVVEFGGAEEITVAASGSTRIAGVISTAPGFLMNTGLKGATVMAVAFTGRVPCKVSGPVRKGDLMIAGPNGHAMRAPSEPKAGMVIGKALANFDGQSGVIEVAVGR